MKNLRSAFFSLVAATVLLASCGQSGTTTATADTAAAGAPVMKFEKESHDFGKIKTGDKTTYDFKFTNTGNVPLIVTDAIATCGCTKPEWPKTPVKPGASGIIKVTFNSEGKKGLQDKMITVTANTKPPQNMVHLIGEVTN